MITRLVCSTIATAACLSLGACTSPAGLGVRADDPLFAGLDAGTVSEVLGSPTVKDRVEADEPAEAKARLQNIVRNFYACRSALAVYQEWLKNGKAPAFPTQPMPTHPAMWAEDEDRDIEGFRRDASSGDISVLRTDLTRADGCGDWIPAKPGDTAGPTIADVVRGAK